MTKLIVEGRRCELLGRGGCGIRWKTRGRGFASGCWWKGWEWGHAHLWTVGGGLTKSNTELWMVFYNKVDAIYKLYIKQISQSFKMTLNERTWYFCFVSTYCLLSSSIRIRHVALDWIHSGYSSLSGWQQVCDRASLIGWISLSRASKSGQIMHKTIDCM